ncbi:MAG: glycosyltransferase [Candidatus Dormibacteria bacterium]
MRVSGFTICRDAMRFGYPLQESLRSLLPLVDELVVAVGDGDDGTWEAVTGLGDERIVAFRTKWDPARFDGGRALADQTNLALARCSGDWAMYLQSDEVLHEGHLGPIRERMQRYLDTPVEGLSFRFFHFYGAYDVVQDNWCAWYRRETRAVRTGRGVASVGDAAGFRIKTGQGMRRLIRADAAATVYHYGWVRPPALMVAKQAHAVRTRSETAAATTTDENPFTALGNLMRFPGVHPHVMRGRIAARDWTFDDAIAQQPPRWARHLALARTCPRGALRLLGARWILSWNSLAGTPKVR